MNELITQFENIAEFLFNNGYNSWGTTTFRYWTKSRKALFDDLRQEGR